MMRRMSTRKPKSPDSARTPDIFHRSSVRSTSVSCNLLSVFYSQPFQLELLSLPVLLRLQSTVLLSLYIAVLLSLHIVVPTLLYMRTQRGISPVGKPYSWEGFAHVFANNGSRMFFAADAASDAPSKSPSKLPAVAGSEASHLIADGLARAPLRVTAHPGTHRRAFSGRPPRSRSSDFPLFDQVKFLSVPRTRSASTSPRRFGRFRSAVAATHIIPSGASQPADMNTAAAEPQQWSFLDSRGDDLLWLGKHAVRHLPKIWVPTGWEHSFDSKFLRSWSSGTSVSNSAVYSHQEARCRHRAETHAEMGSALAGFAEDLARHAAVLLCGSFAR